jgi:hypothetical protein
VSALDGLRGLSTWTKVLLVTVPFLLVGVLVGTVALLDTGGSAGRDGTAVPPAVLTQSAPTAASTVAPPRSGPEEPEVVSWGGHDDQLAVVVRNQADVEVRDARVLITALDAGGRPLVATAGPPDSKCCTIVGLPPGEEFGLFLNLGLPVSEVADVQVRYVDLETAPALAPADRPRVDVGDASLERTPGDAVVTATFTAHGDVGPYVAGQAFLVDRDDRLVGVISGRFYCFGPDTTRRLRMQLLRPVPAGTRIQKVLAHPIPAGAPANVQDPCN